MPPFLFIPPVYFFPSTSPWASLKRGVKRKKLNPSIEQRWTSHRLLFSILLCVRKVSPLFFHNHSWQFQSHTSSCDIWLLFSQTFKILCVFTWVVFICVHIFVVIIVPHTDIIITSESRVYVSVWIGVEKLKWKFHIINLEFCQFPAFDKVTAKDG